MISVIIPAHNEANVIGRCLRSMLDGCCAGELEIVVACNGCTDETAKIAQAFGEAVRVIEVPAASKVAALNAGDRAAQGFPRFYVDADVVLPLHAIREVARVLTEGQFLAAAPRMDVDLRGRKWLVRAFYRVWLRVPYHRRGMIGSGVYALSEAGRRRFDHFPEIIADDGYIRSLFTDGERAMVDSVAFTIFPPATFWGLIKIKTRARLGFYEWRVRYPELAGTERRSAGSSFRELLRQPRLWPYVPVYALVNLITRLRARRQFAAGQLKLWERDDSARTAPAHDLRRAM